MCHLGKDTISQEVPINAVISTICQMSGIYLIKNKAPRGGDKLVRVRQCGSSMWGGEVGRTRRPNLPFKILPRTSLCPRATYSLFFSFRLYPVSFLSTFLQPSLLTKKELFLCQLLFPAKKKNTMHYLYNIIWDLKLLSVSTCNLLAGV